MTHKSTPFWRRFALSFFAVLITLVLVELLCGWFLSLGYKVKPSYEMASVHNPQRELLPSEMPESMSSRPRFSPEPIPDFEGDPGELIEEVHYAHSVIPERLLKSTATRTRRYQKSTGRVLFDHQVTVDQYGRRISRSSPKTSQAPLHLLMMGCSYVFGTAIGDEDTITWQMNLKQNKVEAYNGGNPGYGTADVLARFLVGDEMSGIEQKRGVLVYNFIADHIPRSLGSSSIPWTDMLSYVTEQGDGAFRLEGSFVKSRPKLTAFYKWFARRNISQLFGLHLPILRKSHYDLIARMLLQTEKLYKAQSHPENQLVVVIYPQTVQGINIEYFRQALSRHQIRFLDYSSTDISKVVQGRARIPYDHHPSALANAVFAEVLLQDLSPLIAPFSASR